MATTPVTQSTRLGYPSKHTNWEGHGPWGIQCTSDYTDITECTARAYEWTAMAWQTGEAMSWAGPWVAKA